MITVRVLKLGTKCRDKATELEGTLTHWVLSMGKGIYYLFQPEGLNEEGQPVNKLILESARLEVGDSDFEEVEVPFEILGTTVTDKSSGFTGMAVDFIRHINGCFHVGIQPKGRLPKTNAPIRKCEFDLRECAGDMIAELSKVELEKSRAQKPSPTGDDCNRVVPVESKFPDRHHGVY